MFENLRRIVGDLVENAAHATLPGLGTVPFEAAGRPFDTIPLQVISDYTGLEVAKVEPLHRFAAGPATGPAAGLANGMANKMAALFAEGQERLAAAAREDNADPELAERAARGAQLRPVVDAAMAETLPGSWAITLANGKQATVRIFPLGDSEAGFETLKSKEKFQRTQRGARQEHDNVFDQHVRQLMAAPYKSYYDFTRLCARGLSHDAVATGRFGKAHDNESLAALAALALCSLEGNPPTTAIS
ncbi:hypothetical protein AL755_06495 [Arthrobacter sp. ERGS1:01]|uniref:hypothetical protein n=1 Tax=Arthrobacter sp. ERGS1:01 TaxID=1704044 RepID=UPI0006B51186|nr:hypothetical protein [Arthrobacter sp. ERGS1:01]ALE05210.1 hypothetical protein AL755_06495 [Arthrobacter sp. ERGS1:01]